MADDKCTLMGCSAPRIDHHHHWLHGHLVTGACTCTLGGEPGFAGGDQ